MSSIGSLYDKRTDKDNKGIYKISFYFLALFIPSVLFALDIPPTEFARCSAIKNNVERLSCFDDLSKQYKLDKPAVSITSKGNWAITKSISPIDDSTNIYLGATQRRRGLPGRLYRSEMGNGLSAQVRGVPQGPKRALQAIVELGGGVAPSLVPVPKTLRSVSRVPDCVCTCPMAAGQSRSGS